MFPPWFFCGVEVHLSLVSPIPFQATLVREQEALTLREREVDGKLARVAEIVRSQKRRLRAEFCDEEVARWMET